MCPIPTTSTQNPIPSTQVLNPDASHQQPSKGKAPAIRKAPRYRAPKSLGGINITTKVEFVPATALTPTEPSIANSNPLSSASAPLKVGSGNIPQSTSSTVPNATTLRSAPPIILPASGNESLSTAPGPPLLPLTQIQVGKLPELIDKAQRTASMYTESRAVTRPTASRDGRSHPLDVLPYRLSVLSTHSISQASSSKVTLEDINPPRGSSPFPSAVPPNS